MDRPLRRARDSYTEQVQIIMPQHVNGAHRLFGGQLMAGIDVAAAVAAAAARRASALSRCSL